MSLTPVSQFPAIWPDIGAHLRATRPDHPVLYLAPGALQARADRFLAGFPGRVTYAVKANPHPLVLGNLAAAGVNAFDVASPAEMEAVRAACPGAVLHYNNPMRSEAEIAAGIRHGVASWSVDDLGDLDRLGHVPKSCEMAVRFALPVAGAAYDFGAKFGADCAMAAEILRAVAARGWQPALCFHPGTQCADPQAWAAYIRAARGICQAAGVTIGRLNIGGGFAADHFGAPLALERVFDVIASEVAGAFGMEAPDLVCEPGRAMVSVACCLVTRIKGMRGGGADLYLNDGIYGGLMDLRDMGNPNEISVMSPDAAVRRGAMRPRRLFGPTCDSLDVLPQNAPLPEATQPGDYVLFHGLGAYSLAMSTGFNGYGLREIVMVHHTGGQMPQKG